MFFKVCDVADVVEGQGIPVEVDGLIVAIFNDGGQFHALLKRCPHANGPMGRGWIEEGEVVLSAHRWRFNLTDRRCCTTVRGNSLHRFRCEVRDHGRFGLRFKRG